MSKLSKRQGRKIGCIEEAAFTKGLIDAEQLFKNRLSSKEERLRCLFRKFS